MESTVLSAAEAVEYGEFKRTRREAEIAVTLRKLVVDASRRETDKHALKAACESAKKVSAAGVLVSPVNVASAKRCLSESATAPICLVGGTGESLPALKKAEAKKAVRQGAREIRLVLCYSALRGGNYAYLRREVKKVRRAVRRYPLFVSLEDHSLGENDIALGVRAACAGGADGVCVRGETELILRAVRAGGGKLRADASDAENAEQLRSLFRAGASRVGTGRPEQLAAELYRTAAEEAEQIHTVRPPQTPSE